MKIGYKGFKNDMTCRTYKFEKDKVYFIDKGVIKTANTVVDYNQENIKLRLCTSDVFHYCNELKDVDKYYKLKGVANRFFKIQILGSWVDGDKGKSGTTSFRILEELSKQDINKAYGEMLRDNQDVFFDLINLRALQEKFPMIMIGGSLSLYLRGYSLDRFKSGEGDYDIISPYWVDLADYEGITQHDDEKNSGNDFDDTFYFQGRKIDLCISPESRYEIITYRGHEYKVNALIDVIEAKARYAKTKGGRKHLNDLVELMSQNKQEWQ